MGEEAKKKKKRLKRLVAEFHACFRKCARSGFFALYDCFFLIPMCLIGALITQKPM